MRRLFCLFLFFAAVLTAGHCYAQWVTQNSGTTQHLYDVYFINSQTGWACGNNGTILKSTDGGNNWFFQNSGVTFPIYSIHFTNANTGYGVTRVDGYFIKTTNGGLNWNTIFFSPKSFESIFFINSLTGWAAGISGTGWVFRTTDAGVNWDSVNIVNSGSGKDIEFINAQTGWAAIGGIYKTTDGGENWFLQYSPVAGEIQSLSFPSESTGYAVSLASWRVYKTTNSGENWEILTTLPVCFDSECIFFSNINTGWVSGGCGQMFSTTNGGLNWFQQQTSTNSFLKTVQFISDSVGWAVGGAGRIIHTDSMGQVQPVVIISTEIPEQFHLFQNYPNPFNSETIIKFTLIKQDNYSLTVYDVLGRKVGDILNKELRAGTYEVSYSATDLASGIYIFSLASSKAFITKKFCLIK